jgi:MFS family permease
MFVNRVGTLIVPFMTLYLQETLGLGVEFATRAIGAYGLGAIVASALGGHLADRIGRRVVMLIGLLGGAGILLVFGSLRSPSAILLASLGFALVSEMYRPAASAMIADLVEPDRRAHAFGLMYFSINLGFSIGPAIGGMLAKYSFLWLFWGDALTSSAYALIVFVGIRETLPSRRVPGASSPQSESRRTDDASTSQTITLRQAVKHILLDRVFMIFCIASLVIAVVYMQCMSTFPLYLGQHDIGPATYGKLIALNGLMIVLFQLPVTMIVTRYRRGTIVALGAVVIAIGFGLTGVATSVWHFALTIVIWTTGELMHAPLMQAIVSDLAPIELRARYMGVFSMCFSGAMMIGAPLGGFVLARLGGAYVWGGCLAVALVAALMYLSVHKPITAGRAESTG